MRRLVGKSRGIGNDNSPSAWQYGFAGKELGFIVSVKDRVLTKILGAGENPGARRRLAGRRAA